MRRFALRGLRSDEGLGLVETVVALLVFSLIMSGLAASMAMFAHQTTLARARASATTLAQQYVEKARAVGANLLQNCDSTTSYSPYPPSHAPYRGAGSYLVVQGNSSNCIPYQKSVSQDGITFTLTRLVLQKETPQEDVAGQTIEEKYFVVQVSWTDAGGHTQTYELDTIMNQNGSNVVAPAQGIRFVIKDVNGNIITADSATWAVKITSTDGGTLYTSTDAVSAEGTYSQLDLATGSYTCTATENSDASDAGYQPGAHPTYNSTLNLGADGVSVSGTCTVSTNTVTDFVTTWQTSSDCAKSATTGTVNFLVTDSNGSPLNAMTVTLTDLTDGTKTYTKPTGANGHADGIKPAADWYTYTVTDSTGKYVAPQNSYGPICIVAGQTFAPNPVTVAMTSPSSCATTGTNGTFNFSVQDATTHNAVSDGFEVSVINANTGAVTAFPNTKKGASSKAVPPGLYYYMAAPPNGNTTYQGSGILGTTCLAASGTQNITISLGASTCTRGSGPDGKGNVAFAVQDEAGNPISGATITLISVDGDTVPPTQTTGSNGTYTFSQGPPPPDTRATAGPYQYLVTGPGSQYKSSFVTTMLCVVAGQTTTAPTVVLKGIVSVAVTVRNNDALPFKTYQVTVTPSNPTTDNPAVTQLVTVPNCTPGSGCTRNPSAALTFSNLLTGQYVITVCAQLSDTNCSNVATAPTQPAGSTTTTYYSFLTPGTTYTSSMTGFGDLATIDSSDDDG